jgi:pimeloyl-ACP methyl ester carboxylesterase
VNTIISKDGTPIYYKDWGRGPVVTLSHGWPLNADAWDGQMLFLVQNRFRVIAHDRRGHGRSGQASSGNDMNGYADDLAAVIETLELRTATLVGHSTGGGEVVRFIGRHGTERVAKAVLIAAVPPLMLKTTANPEGLPLEVFDSIRANVAKDRSQYYKDLALQFYGANRPGAKVSQGVLDQFWLWSMQSGAQERVRVHQGVLRDGLRGGSREDRCPDSRAAWRGRSDRAGQRLRTKISTPHQGRKENLLSRCAAWADSDASGTGERRSAGVSEGVNPIPSHRPL